MEQQNNNSTVIIEKKAPNKVGLIILIIVILLLIGSISYLFLFKKDMLSNYLPWLKKESKQQTDNTSTKKEEKALIINKKVYNDKNIDIVIDDIIIQDNDYVIKTSITNKKEIEFNLKSDKIIFNDFETNNNFDFNLKEKSKSKEEIMIHIKDLDLLNIKNDNSINIVAYLQNENTNKQVSFEIKYKQDIIKQSNYKVIDLYPTNDGVTISYYKKTTDSQFNYLYFQIENNSTKDYDISIKELYIDNHFYNKTFSLNSSANLKKTFYIKIPCSKYKEFETIKISFFMIDSNSGTEIYSTELTKINTNKNKKIVM